MGSTDLVRLEQRARAHYELVRVMRAVLAFVPALAIVAIAAAVGRRPSSALGFGATMFVLGVALLWYGREPRRGVLPGLLAGSLPLALTLCATRVGHVCGGDHCVSLCIPACTIGGLSAGVLVARTLYRKRRRPLAWLAASGIALLTGAMGCTCVGYAGVAGLVLGYGVAVIPLLARSRVRG